MRTLLKAACGLAAMFGLSAASATTLSIESDVADVLQRGDQFSVAVNYEGEASDILTGYVIDLFVDLPFELINVSFVDPTLGFNPLSIPGFDEIGADFSAEDFGDAVNLTGISGNTDGTLLDNQPLDFTIATLTFEAVRNGFGDIGLDVFFDLFGIAGAPLDVEFGNDLISAEVVPVPGAIVFLATGLAGLFARRRMAA